MAAHSKRVLAVGAHPDDVEFFMAGTLLLLGRAGYEMHYMNIANGCCGSTQMGPGEAVDVRRRESLAACQLIGATYHPSLVNDMEIVYELETVARLAAVMRQIDPEIVLTHPPTDYMEDHETACRLAVTAAFTREMPNFRTDPPVPTVVGPVSIYHAQPNGNRTPLGEVVRPNLFVDISSVMQKRTEMLACHRSQGEWLEASQRLPAFVETARALVREVGQLSGQFEYAEGWRKHLHLGFSGADHDPLCAALGELVLKA